MRARSAVHPPPAARRAAPDVASLDLPSWLTLQHELLETERAEEVAASIALLSSTNVAELCARGVVLPRLIVAEATTGLFGRVVVRLADHLERALPAHKFSPGDIVGLRVAGRSGSGGGVGASVSALSAGGDARASYDASGVVTRADEKSVFVALDEDDGADARDVDGSGRGVSVDERVRLDRLADDVTFKRLRDVVARVARGDTGPAARLISLLFQGAAAGGPTGVASLDGGAWATPAFSMSVPAPRGAGATAAEAAASADGWVPLRPDLNASQKAAISAALRARDVCLIHGPPGTGKTTTVVEFIRQEVLRGTKVLACAPSNVAVDNLLERLAAAGGVRVLRLGHPARISPALLAHSLDAALASAEGAGIVADARKDLARVSAEAKATRNKVTRRELRGEERALRKEVRVREKKLLVSAIRNADVVLTTVTGAASGVLGAALAAARAGAPPGEPARALFDLCVIDEAAQALEAAALIPMLQAPRLVCAGDHCQLPPTVTSEDAAARGLAFTLAERIVRLWGDGTVAGDARVPPLVPFAPRVPVVHMLTEQYRMHATISDWSSGAMYDGRLVPHSSVATHRLSGLPHTSFPTPTEDDPEPLVIVPAAVVADLRAGAAAAARDSLLEEGNGGAGGGADGRRSGKMVMDAATAAVIVASAAAPHGGGGGGGGAADDVSIDVAALDAPLLLIDTAGCSMYESVEGGEGGKVNGSGGARGSKSNTGEADIVLKHVIALVTGGGLRQRDVGVLTPYNAQATLLRALLHGSFPGVTVSTVDGFQGQEIEALVISCVRSNAQRTVGFLADARRMNVAVTRARRHCAIVGDSDTLNSDAFLAKLIAYAADRGDVRSATDYADVVRGAAAPPRTTAAPPSRKKEDRDRVPRYGMDAPLSAVAQTWLSTARRQLRVFASACDGIDFDRPAAAPAVAAIALPGRDALPFSVARTELVRGTPQLLYDATLTPLQRALVHRAADDLGLKHSSTGDVTARILTVTYLESGARKVQRAVVAATPASARATLGEGGGERNGTSSTTGGRVEEGEGSVKEGGRPPEAEADGNWAALLDGLDLCSDDDDDDDGSGRGGADSGVHAQVFDVPPATTDDNSPPLQQTGKLNAKGKKALAKAARAAEAATKAATASLQPPSTQPYIESGGHALGTGEGRAPLLSALHAERAERAQAAKMAASSTERLLAAADAPECHDSIVDVKRKSRQGAGGGSKPSGGGPKKAASGTNTAGSGSGLSVKLKPQFSGALDDDDEDALLDALVASVGKCSAARCTKSTTTTGATCKLCRLRFCYEHGMPEVHGCGDAARGAARAAWLANGGGAGPSPTKNREGLEARLAKKLDEATKKK